MPDLQVTRIEEEDEVFSCGSSGQLQNILTVALV